MWNNIGSARSQLFQTKISPILSNINTIYYTLKSLTIAPASKPSQRGKACLPTIRESRFFSNNESIHIVIHIQLWRAVWPWGNHHRRSPATPMCQQKSPAISVGDFKPWMKTRRPWCPQIFKNISPNEFGESKNNPWSSLHHHLILLRSPKWVIRSF